MRVRTMMVIKPRGKKTKTTYSDRHPHSVRNDVLRRQCAQGRDTAEIYKLLAKPKGDI